MAVYVDWMEAPYRGMIMCHMMADSEQELLEMADKIGVQRKWYQQPGKHKTSTPHFDICKTKKALAINHGAIELQRTLGGPELLAVIKRSREWFLEKVQAQRNATTEVQHETFL